MGHYLASTSDLIAYFPSLPIYKGTSFPSPSTGMLTNSQPKRVMCCPQGLVPKLSHCCFQLVIMLSLCCPEVVSKLSQSCFQLVICHKHVPKLFPICIKVVLNCPTVVTKLYQTYLKIVSKLSPSCLKVDSKLAQVVHKNCPCMVFPSGAK